MMFFFLSCICNGSITPLQKSSSAEVVSNSVLLLVMNSKSGFDSRSNVSLRETSSCFIVETSLEKEKRGEDVSEHITENRKQNGFHGSNDRIYTKVLKGR